MKFYGQFEPPVDRFIFERYFPDTNFQGVFVECGAFDGLTECSCKFFEETMGWTGFNLEPLPWIFEKLVENRPNATNINLALSAERGVAKFVAVDHPSFGLDCTNGSLSHSPSHKELLDQAGCEYKEIEVKLINWRDFILEQKITHVDLFVLDVEGHELSVIEGMQGSNVLPDVMCVEFGHLGLNTVRNKLKLLGYVYDITSNANAYFIRKDKAGLSPFFYKKINNFIKKLIT